MLESASSNAPKIPDERSFGLVVGGILTVWGIYGVVTYSWSMWLTPAGSLLALLGWQRPRSLNHLNKAWFNLGRLLHWIISPLIMGLLYLLAIVPLGLILKFTKRDVMGRKWPPPKGITRWQVRKDAVETRDRLTHLF